MSQRSAVARGSVAESTVLGVSGGDDSGVSVMSACTHSDATGGDSAAASSTTLEEYEDARPRQRYDENSAALTPLPCAARPEMRQREVVVVQRMVCAVQLLGPQPDRGGDGNAREAAHIEGRTTSRCGPRCGPPCGGPPCGPRCGAGGTALWAKSVSAQQLFLGFALITLIHLPASAHGAPLPMRWVKGGRGQSCGARCAELKRTCSATRMNAVDTTAKLQGVEMAMAAWHAELGCEKYTLPEARMNNDPALPAARFEGEWVPGTNRGEPTWLCSPTGPGPSSTWSTSTCGALDYGYLRLCCCTEPGEDPVSVCPVSASDCRNGTGSLLDPPAAQCGFAHAETFTCCCTTAGSDLSTACPTTLLDCDTGFTAFVAPETAKDGRHIPAFCKNYTESTCPSGYCAAIGRCIHEETFCTAGKFFDCDRGLCRFPDIVVLQAFGGAVLFWLGVAANFAPFIVIAVVIVVAERQRRRTGVAHDADEVGTVAGGPRVDDAETASSIVGIVHLVRNATHLALRRCGIFATTAPRRSAHANSRALAHARVAQLHAEAALPRRKDGSLIPLCCVNPMEESFGLGLFFHDLAYIGRVLAAEAFLAVPLMVLVFIRNIEVIDHCRV